MTSHFTIRVSSIFLLVSIIFTAMTTTSHSQQPSTTQTRLIKVGIIGLDTSHCVAFATAMNDPKRKGDLAKVEVVAAFPGGSHDIPDSRNRVEGYTKELRKLGRRDRPSIEALLPTVDVVLLESVDGRPHLEQVKPVFKAGKPVFIDKPVAGSLADAIEIFRLAREHNVPCFSSSSLRFSPGILKVKDDPKLGDVLGCDAYGPCSLEPHHPDLFWYGIHGVETLFTIMGTGCQSVARTQTPDAELVVGVWKDGRIGTFRGIRAGKSDYGGHRLRQEGDRHDRPLRRLRAAGRGNRQVLHDEEAAGERRGDARDLRLHGSRRRKQATGRRAGDDRERDGQGASQIDVFPPLPMYSCGRGAGGEGPGRRAE